MAGSMARALRAHQVQGSLNELHALTRTEEAVFNQPVVLFNTERAQSDLCVG